MPYASLPDLEARYGVTEIVQISDRDDTGVVDIAVVTEMLTDADALIDSYLVGRYAVPVVGQALVKRLACDITRRLLWKDAAPEQVIKAYDAAVTTLKDLSAGRASLVGAAPAPADAAPATPRGDIRYSAPDRILTRGRLGDYLG